MFCIYKHTNKIDKKVYIGQTMQNPPEKRQHPSNYKNNTYFYNAIQKYGQENFEHEIIENNLSLKEANEKEAYQIKYYDSTNHDKGYNIRLGGNNSLLSEETKKKMSQNHRNVKGENNFFYGKHFIGEQHPMYGKHHSEETKEKISKSKINKNGTPVKCKNNGKVFNTAAEAGRYFNIKGSCHIIECCRNIRKSAGKDPLTKEPLHQEFYENEIFDNK